MSWSQRFALFALLGFAAGASGQEVQSAGEGETEFASHAEVVSSSLTPITAQDSKVDLRQLESVLDRLSAKILTTGKMLPAKSTANQYSEAAALKCPTTKAGLADGWRVFAHSLDRNAAVALSVWTSAEVSAADKIILYYFTWYKDFLDSDGEVVGRCGSGVQLALKATNLKADAQITLPALAASTQLGIAQVDYRLSTFGISGPAIDKAAPRSGSVGNFDAQAYAELMSSIDKIQAAGTAGGAAVTFTPRLIAIPNINTGEADKALEVLVQTKALRQLAKGSSCADARGSIPERNSSSDALVNDLYRSVAGPKACSVFGGVDNDRREQMKELLANFDILID